MYDDHAIQRCECILLFAAIPNTETAQTSSKGVPDGSWQHSIGKKRVQGRSFRGAFSGLGGHKPQLGVELLKLSKFKILVNKILLSPIPKP